MFIAQKAKSAFVPANSHKTEGKPGYHYNSQTGKSKWYGADAFNSGNQETVTLSHRITHAEQFSNAWLVRCGCGELFTGKGITYPVNVRKHLFETEVTVEV